MSKKVHKPLDLTIEPFELHRGSIISFNEEPHIVIGVDESDILFTIEKIGVRDSQKVVLIEEIRPIPITDDFLLNNKFEFHSSCADYSFGIGEFVRVVFGPQRRIIVACFDGHFSKAGYFAIHHLQHAMFSMNISIDFNYEKL